jgi:RNA polymerase sigma-B factor
MARRYADRGEQLEDLVQAGCEGLVKAADRFDHRRGIDFRAYATPTILGEIRRHFRDHAWALKVPRSVKEDHFAVTRCVERMTATLGRTPTVTEIADELELGSERVLDALASTSAYRPRSLSEGGLGEQEVSETVGSVDDGFRLTEDRIALSRALGTLPARERVIVYLRLDKGMLQAEIAELLGMSQMHVSRLLARATQALQAAAAGDAAPQVRTSSERSGGGRQRPPPRSVAGGG